MLSVLCFYCTFVVLILHISVLLSVHDRRAMIDSFPFPVPRCRHPTRQRRFCYTNFAPASKTGEHFKLLHVLSVVVLYMCSDIDECAANMDNCSEGATCHNTEGGFNCSCNSGYHGDGFNCYGELSKIVFYSVVGLDKKVILCASCPQP